MPDFFCDRDSNASESFCLVVMQPINGYCITRQQWGDCPQSRLQRPRPTQHSSVSGQPTSSHAPTAPAASQQQHPPQFVQVDKHVLG